MKRVTTERDRRLGSSVNIDRHQRSRSNDVRRCESSAHTTRSVGHLERDGVRLSDEKPRFAQGPYVRWATVMSCVLLVERMNNIQVISLAEC